MDLNQCEIAQVVSVSGGSVPDLIGDPTCGYMSQSSLESGTLIHDDMEKRLMIAQLTPKLPDMTGDHNIYRGKVELTKFKTDLRENAGVRFNPKNGCLNIALSTMIPITESYSNEYGQSELLSGMSGMLSGGMLGELGFASNTRSLVTRNKDGSFSDESLAGQLQKLADPGMSADGKTKKEGNIAQKALGGGLNLLKAGLDKAKSFKDTLKGSDNVLLKGIGNAAEKIGEAINKPGSKIDWPLFWKNCSFQQQYECTTRLWCYNTHNDQEYKDRILALIAAMQMFVCPRSDDGFLYEWPYLTSFDIIGSVHMPLAYISNLSVIKGGDVGDFSLSGRPNIVDLRFTISSLYSVCVNAPLKVENQNVDRPAVSKTIRALRSYKHWGKPISPCLNGPTKGAEKKVPANLPTNAAEVEERAAAAAAEVNAKMAREGTKASKLAEASDFMYQQVQADGTLNTDRMMEDVMEANKKTAEAEEEAARSAAEAERSKKQGEGEGEGEGGDQTPSESQPTQDTQPEQSQPQEEKPQEKTEEEKQKEKEKLEFQKQKEQFEQRF